MGSKESGLTFLLDPAKLGAFLRGNSSTFDNDPSGQLIPGRGIRVCVCVEDVFKRLGTSSRIVLQSGNAFKNAGLFGPRVKSL